MAGTLGFLGLHAVLLALVASLLLGMLGGLLALTVGLLRSPGVPRWVPACRALFLPLDLLADGARPVDPHWLPLAVGVALMTRPAAAKP